MSHNDPPGEPPSVDRHTVDDVTSGVHIVRIDYTNTSAQVLDPNGECIALYGPGVTRHTLDQFLAADGWQLVPGCQWTTSSPPDGREHPIRKEIPVTDQEPAPDNVLQFPAVRTIESNAAPSELPEPLELLTWPRIPEADIAHAITERFGPGEIVIGVNSGSASNRFHSTIHGGPLRAGQSPVSSCQLADIKTVIAVTDDTRFEAVAALLQRGGHDLCRMCHRCWPSDLIPQHDKFYCHTQYELANRARRILSAEAVAVIAGMVAPSEEVNADGIMTSDQVWDEVRAAFPIETFWAWVAEHNKDEDDLFYIADPGC